MSTTDDQRRGADHAAAPAKDARSRFAGLQWLRGFAALLVVCEHVKFELLVRLLGSDPSRPLPVVFPFSAGVDVFFVISGFVIAHSSAPLLGRRGAWRVFAARRLARVVPLYWLVTAAFLGLLFVGENRLISHYSVPFVVGSFLFLPIPRADGTLLPVLPLGWTLNYEMLFYAVFAAAIGFPRRAAPAVVAAALLLVVAAGQVAVPTSPPLRFWSDPIVLEFLAGVAVHAAVARGLRLSRPARLALAAAALVLLWAFARPDGVPFRPLAWGGPAAMLVLAAAADGGSRRADRLADAAGDLSYALYLGHLFVLLALTRLWLRFGSAGDPWAAAAYPPVAIGLAILFAAALHHGVERPVLRVLRRRLDGSPAPPGP